MPSSMLISGSRIVNSRIGSPGTLGFIGIGPDDDNFLVSCYHVLGRIRGSMEPLHDQETIWHTGALESQMVALTDVELMNARFDFAAARLIPGIPVSAEILTLGPIKGVVTATEGMRVFKFGAETGLTEGRISSVSDTLIEIESDPDADSEFLLADRGDSGALWVSTDGEAIAMHFQGSDGSRAFARPMPFVLSTLGLTLLTSSA
jgi:hypothetical protein